MGGQTHIPHRCTTSLDCALLRNEFVIIGSYIFTRASWEKSFVAYAFNGLIVFYLLKIYSSSWNLHKRGTSARAQGSHLCLLSYHLLPTSILVFGYTPSPILYCSHWQHSLVSHDKTIIIFMWYSCTLPYSLPFLPSFPATVWVSLFHLKGRTEHCATVFHPFLHIRNWKDIVTLGQTTLQLPLSKAERSRTYSASFSHFRKVLSTNSTKHISVLAWQRD